MTQTTIPAHISARAAIRANAIMKGVSDEPATVTPYTWQEAHAALQALSGGSLDCKHMLAYLEADRAIECAIRGNEAARKGASVVTLQDYQKSTVERFARALVALA